MKFYSSCCLPVIIKWKNHPSVVWKSTLLINHSAQSVTRGELNEHFRNIYKNLRPRTGMIFSIYLVVSTDRSLLGEILSISYFILQSIWSKQVYFPLHRPWLLHRVNFLSFNRLLLWVRKVFTWGEKWHVSVSVLGLLFFSLFMTSSTLPHPLAQHPNALMHF